MAYDKKELERQAIEAIKEHGLIYIQEVCAFLPCSSSTFYNLQMEKVESIKAAIQDNKVKGKAELRAKWRNQKNATTELALYKLYANDDELERLSVQKHEHSGKDGKDLKINVQVFGEDEPVLDEPKDDH